jgi:integrase
LETDVADLVHFLFATAWRVSEAQGLTWPQVDATHIVLATSKNGQARKIPIAGEILEIVQRRHARRIGSHVFHRAGKPISSFRHQWRRALRAAGLEGYLVHDLRRSAILRMIERGADQKAAMEERAQDRHGLPALPDHRRPADGGGSRAVAEMSGKARQARADRGIS